MKDVHLHRHKQNHWQITMTLWQVTNRTTGEVVHAYTSDEPVSWQGMEFAQFNHIAVIDKAPTPPARRLSKLGFIGRIGAEFAAILAAAKVNVEVEMFVRMLDWTTPDSDGTSVDLDDPRVISALNSLEASGLIGVGRAAEILA